MATVVLKLGGSLTRNGPPDALLRTIGGLVGDGQRLVVVPGGGVYADAVRRARCLDDSQAHWLAILAMDRMACRLAARMLRLGVDAVVARSRNGIVRALDRGHVPMLAPFGWQRAADRLPHGWHVTGDSIAAGVAAELHASLLVLLKSVDGVAGAAGALSDEAASDELGDVVDDYFASALAPTIDCWIVNGQYPARLRALLAYGTTDGTRVHRSRRVAIAHAQR